MKNNHEIILRQYAAYYKEQPLYLGTAGSYGMEMLTIIREGVWAEYDILAAFHPPVGAAVQVRVGANNQIGVPIEATAEKGMGEIVFAGYKEGVRQIAVDVLYKVVPSSGASGTEPAEPTPDVVQQIMLAANAAEKLAQSVRDDADVGKFTGAKGDKGDIGPTGPKGEQGPKGERGEKGDPGKDAVIDTTLSHAGEAADAAEVGKLKKDIYNQVEKTLSNDEFDWQSGWYEPDGSVHTHVYFKHSKVFKTVQGSTITFKNLRAPANYIACIACFSGAKYVHDISLKGEAYTPFSSGTFTVPENIDGVSFVSYVDAATATSIAVTLTLIETRCDENRSNIESLISENQEIKKQIRNVTEDVAEIYDITNYTIKSGFSVTGYYYDKNGKLNPASNMSTTGIINVPLGIKSIEYTAMRNIDIPTILFFGADMGIVGTVIAATAPVYGDTTYSGYADIPPDAVYMEFSANNTADDAKIVVTFSRIDNNQKRIKILEKDPLAGLKITCTGNSITAATHSVPGHGYVEQIADAHGMTVDNHAIWGAIIPQGHPRAGGGITDIGCIHDTLDSMDADADIIVMSGSINDCEYYSDASFLGEITGDFSSDLDLATFYGALEDMCKKALQKWAGKPIIYVIEHRMTLDNTTYGQYYLKLHEAIVKVMNKWGISIVDLFNDCPSLNYNEGYKTKYTTGDGTHPNYEGYERFYVPRVYTEIKKLLGI